jgi:hypothetical protein
MFMKNLKSLRGVAIALVALAVCIAPALAAGPSVGDLLVKFAEVKNLDASTPVQARDSLVLSGMKLPDLDLDKRLTQGDVVSISAAAGINLRTSTPSTPFTQGQLENFGVTLDNVVGGSSTDEGDNTTKSEPWDNGADPRDKGQGLKKGLYKSPSEPL